MIGHELPLVRILSIAPYVALIIILCMTTNLIARNIWKIWSRFDSSLYPDLNGTWEGEIITDQGVSIPARALVRQTSILTQIDLHTETSKSVTLETTPVVESGQCKLYYTYRSKPKNPDWSQYTGSTIFDVRASMEHPHRPLELSGHYFTDRRTVGRVILRQVDSKLAKDVSYY
ncbi:hypothetical protein [Methylobacterium tardum]|nr:hypothetical protein [Methylobacterium tardum]URD35803.1 hypothetical protein M6G65_25655 [Methylobacterium tardum]